MLSFLESPRSYKDTGFWDCVSDNLERRITVVDQCVNVTDQHHKEWGSYFELRIEGIEVGVTIQMAICHTPSEIAHGLKRMLIRKNLLEDLDES